MPNHCCVPFCGCTGGFKFPTDPDLREKWRKAIHRHDEWKPSKNSTVCQKHFPPEVFCYTTDAGEPRSRVSVVKGTVPSIFCWNDPGFFTDLQERQGPYRDHVINKKLSNFFGSSDHLYEVKDEPPDDVGDADGAADFFMETIERAETTVSETKDAEVEKPLHLERTVENESSTNVIKPKITEVMVFPPQQTNSTQKIEGPLDLECSEENERSKNVIKQNITEVMVFPPMAIYNTQTNSTPKIDVFKPDRVSLRDASAKKIPATPKQRPPLNVKRINSPRNVKPKQMKLILTKSLSVEKMSAKAVEPACEEQQSLSSSSSSSSCGRELEPACEDQHSLSSSCVRDLEPACEEQHRLSSSVGGNGSQAQQGSTIAEMFKKTKFVTHSASLKSFPLDSDDIGTKIQQLICSKVKRGSGLMLMATVSDDLNKIDVLSVDTIVAGTSSINRGKANTEVTTDVKIDGPETCEEKDSPVSDIKKNIYVSIRKDIISDDSKIDKQEIGQENGLLYADPVDAESSGRSLNGSQASALIDRNRGGEELGAENDLPSIDTDMTDINENNESTLNFGKDLLSAGTMLAGTDNRYRSKGISRVDGEEMGSGKTENNKGEKGKMSADTHNNCGKKESTMSDLENMNTASSTSDGNVVSQRLILPETETVVFSNTYRADITKVKNQDIERRKNDIELQLKSDRKILIVLHLYKNNTEDCEECGQLRLKANFIKTFVDNIVKFINDQNNCEGVLNNLKLASAGNENAMSYCVRYECEFCDFLCFCSKQFLKHKQLVHFEKSTELTRYTSCTGCGGTQLTYTSSSSIATATSVTHDVATSVTHDVYTSSSSRATATSVTHDVPDQDVQISTSNTEPKQILSESNETDSSEVPTVITQDEIDTNFVHHVGSVKEYLCSICKLTYYARHNLIKHLKTHNIIIKGHKNRKCKTCGKICTTPYSLSMHQYVHQKSKPSKCLKCGLCFKGDKFLRQHIRIVHQRLLTSVCDICGKTYHSRSSFKFHRLTHNVKKPLVCEICGLQYSSKEGFKAHQKFHIGVKEHKCSLCDKAYYSTTSLHNHMNDTHKVKRTQTKVDEFETV